MIALMITLSRAVRSGLKPTPSSMNGDSRPVDARRCRRRAGRSRRGTSAACSCRTRCGRRCRRTRRARSSTETSSTARSSSYVRERNGCSARSLSVEYRRCGSRNVLERWSTTTAARRGGKGARAGHAAGCSTAIDKRVNASNAAGAHRLRERAAHPPRTRVPARAREPVSTPTGPGRWPGRSARWCLRRAGTDEAALRRRAAELDRREADLADRAASLAQLDRAVAGRRRAAPAVVARRARRTGPPWSCPDR